MSKHRAESAEPLPTLAASLAPADTSSQGDPARESIRDSFREPVVAPPALNLVPTGPGSSPIPAPILTTPRRSRVQIATPVTVTAACWTAVVMWTLHGIGYAVVAVRLSGLRGTAHVPGVPAERVGGLLPGTSIAADAGGLVTLFTFLAGLVCVGCLVVVALAVVTLKRSSAARIGVITASGAAVAFSLGPVFGDGSLWWLLTLLTSAASGALLAWDGWWFEQG